MSSFMENMTTVKTFNMWGLQESWMNKTVYFALTLVTYLLIITVNLILIITIILEKGLHEPMYIFICNLSINTLFGTVGFYPIFLNQLLSGVRLISYGACLTQGCVIYTSVLGEITTLSIMAFDRYVALCRPLQYHTILIPLTVGRLLLFAWLYPLMVALVSLGLTLRLPMCGSNIYKVFCDNPSIVNNSCVPITVNLILANCLILVYVLMIISIVYSYCRIVRICLKTAEGRLKFIQTCLPHILVICLFIIVSLCDVLYGWYDKVSFPINTRNAMAVQFLIIPPVFNPIIYGLNMKKIRSAILYNGRIFFCVGPDIVINIIRKSNNQNSSS